MGNYKFCTGLLVTITLYFVVTQYKQVSAAPGTATTVDNGHRIRNRPFLHFSPRLINQYGRFKPDLNEFFVDDDDLFELNKRQASDDYGHLRFGKRDEFDDYGHMRFGRSDTESTRQ